MAANEYYNSTPGQTFEEPTSLVGQTGQFPTSSQIHSSTPPKNPADGYFAPDAPISAFAPSTYVADPHSVGDALPIPPPGVHNPSKYQSPPPPHDPESPVTDESDGSLVHIHHTPHHNPTPDANTSPPPSHHSGSLSLTHSNLQHHSGLGSSVVSPSRGHGPASKKHLRPRELSTHSKNTLIQLLVRQESHADDCKKSLKIALEKLERYKSDLADANSHCRRLEKLYQRLADERMLMQSQVSDTVAKAQQQTYAAQQELSIFKLKLEHTENALALTKEELREIKNQRDKARNDADLSREEAYRIREERNVLQAREQGHKQGYNEGVKQGHVLGITQTVPRAGPSAGDPSNASASVAAPSNPNTSGISTHSQPSRARTATSQSDRRSSSSRDPRNSSKIDVDDLVQKIRKDTEERYQRQFDQQLEQERQRLHILKLEQDQEREREVAEEREKLRQSIEAREHQRAAELEAEMENLRRLERERSEEVRNAQQRASLLQLERDKEKQLKEKEQLERRRERQEREQERAEEAQRRGQEQQHVSMQRQMERAEALQRERERDQAVAEATAQAARAAAEANAAAAASASRPKSRSSGSSSDDGLSHRNQTYMPMPRPPSVVMPARPPVIPDSTTTYGPTGTVLGPDRQPTDAIRFPAVHRHPRRSDDSQGSTATIVPRRRSPVGMPVPRSTQFPVTVPASMSMPEPTFPVLNRSQPSGRSPQPPVTIPASVPMPEPNVNPANYSLSSSRSPQPPVTIPASVSMPEPTVIPRPSSRSAGQPNLPSTVPGRHRPRRSSIESQSSATSTAAGLGGLHNFPLVGVVPGRTPTTSSGGTGTGFIPPLPESNNNDRQSSHARHASHTRSGTGRGVLRNIPEDASLRMSPSVASSLGGEGPVIPPMTMPYPDHSGPVVPDIHVESDRWGPESSNRGPPHMDDGYLHPSGQLYRSGSDPSICGITVEPPSGPGTPMEEGHDVPHHHHHHHHQHSTQNPNLLSPNHIPAPVLPHVPSQEPVLPRRTQSPVLPVRMNARGRSGTASSGDTGGGGGGVPTQPNTPVIPDSQFFPPNFIPQSFTPHTNTAPVLPGGNDVPDVLTNPPPGFIPQSMTDMRTGVTTPLTGMNPLPGDEHGGGGGGSRRQSLYGGASPYLGSPSSGGGRPVIPDMSDMDNTGSNRGTPRVGIYTPGGSSGNLPGTSSVYQNPAEGDEDEENDDLVARNTRINATAPPMQVKQKKKKRR